MRLPNGVFAPYTSIPTNLIFFDRSGPTREIWYYELPAPAGRKQYTKTRPLQFEEFAECLAWYKAWPRQESAQAWRVPVADVLKYDAAGVLVSANLDIKNPERGGGAGASAAGAVGGGDHGEGAADSGVDGGD